jgi:hypothetical protein
MNKYNITKFPVIILSAPRTGSTALSLELKRHLGIPFINEPFNIASKEKTELSDLMNSKQPYILKTHIDELMYPELLEAGPLDNILNNQRLMVADSIKNNECYVIRIRRRNIIDQITSFYIELVRSTTSNSGKEGYWAYYNIIDIPKNIHDPIPYNREHLEYAIYRSLYCNKLMDDFDGPIDLDVWLEDTEIISPELLFTPRPENYTEIKEMVTQKMDSSGTTYSRINKLIARNLNIKIS